MEQSTKTDTSNKLTQWRKDRGAHGPEIDIQDTVRRREDKNEIKKGLEAMEEN